MHLLGKEMVSQATQRSARQLVATSLIVLLAEFFEQPLDGLRIFEVAIKPEVIAGAAFIVVAFQLSTFLSHWFGDYFSQTPMNSGEKHSKDLMFNEGEPHRNHLEWLELYKKGIAETIEAFSKSGSQADLDAMNNLLGTINSHLAAMRPSAVRYGRYRAFYFFGLYLALPVLLAVVALFMAGQSLLAVHP